MLDALRIHQALKNLLILLPLLLSHRIDDKARIFDALVAFATFSLCAAGIYVINDLLDLEADRRHEKKRKRPFASGDLPIWCGFLLIPVLLGISLILAATLPLEFLLYLGMYFCLTMAYSFYLKKKVFADVILLAILYTLRILAGGAATQITISTWMLQFSIFMFFSLALAKRYSELHHLRSSNKEVDGARGYRPDDLNILSIFGASSGLLSALIVALYINSPEVRLLYSRPHWLWLVCPLLIYWISRVWLQASRGRLDEDPVLFALRDRISYMIIFCVGAVIAFSI